MALLQVKTKYGTVRGNYGNNHAYSVFKGIPYAKPPVGELRWKRPVEPDCWDGVRDCLEWGNIPMQGRRPTEGKMSLYTRSHYPRNDMPRSEDCLYLNVWTPAESPEEKLPVAVWIYGGGFVWGFGHQNMFDGEAFNKKGVILVTINYRLGIFGFMAHPELSAEDKEQHVSGNYGLFDQNLALKWVHENISAFGGDPDKVTIFGQSAGAMSCMYQECSPHSKGLFSQAIYQSGGGVCYTDKIQPDLSQMEAIGVEELAKIGINSLAEARALDGEELFGRLEAKNMVALGPNRFGPCFDGFFFPETIIDCIGKRHNNGARFMIGCTADEDAAFVKDLYATARQFGDLEKEYLKAVGAEDGKLPAESYGGLGERFHASGRTLNLFNKEHGFPTGYTYLFSRSVPGGGGAFHGGEHFYIFQTLFRDWRPYEAVDYNLSLAMCSYWTNFIKTGNPNGEGLPVWDKFDVNCQSMELGINIGMVDEVSTPDIIFDAEQTVRLLDRAGGYTDQ